MLVCSRHWTLVQAKRYPKRRRDVDEAVARGLARRRRRGLGHCLSGTCKFRRVRSKKKTWQNAGGPCLKSPSTAVCSRIDVLWWAAHRCGAAGGPWGMALLYLRVFQLSY